jgi:hypothetical protein
LEYPQGVSDSALRPVQHGREDDLSQRDPSGSPHRKVVRGPTGAGSRGG